MGCLANGLGCRAARLGTPVDDLPLFPTSDGDEVSRCAAVGTIYRLAELIGEPVRDSTGAFLFGGHSLRTGGAHMLASRGVNPFRIQSLGRWKSPLVVHCAGESMAMGIADEVARLSAGSQPAAPSPDLASIEGFLRQLDARLQAIETAAEAEPDPEQTRSHPAVVVDDPYVINRDTMAVHRTEATSTTPAVEQRSTCGWRFGLGRRWLRGSRTWHLRVAEIPPGTSWRSICPRCCGVERQLARGEQLSDVD